MTSQRPDRTLDLVSAAYGAAIEPERFDKLLEAWDIWCDEHMHEAAEAFEAITPKFEDAVSAAERLEAVQPAPPAIDATQAPMILMDAGEDVIAVNAAASSLIATGDLDVAHLIGSKRRSDLEVRDGGLGAYRCNAAPGGRVYLAVEAPAGAPIVAQHPDARKVLMLSLIDWDDGFASDLKARFGLSDAELRVARGLLEGQTAQEISGELDRSVATIRSHIKALLQKSGARRQTEFVQLLTILRQAGDADDGAVARVTGDDYRIEDWQGPAGALQVIRYGEGRPVLYFTTSSLPEETPELRRAFMDAGLQVIAPTRPGFRGKRVGGDASQALLADWIDRLAAAAGDNALFVGHREGGILAAKAAAQTLAEGGSVGGLAVISTGAPTLDIAEFETAPDTIRRSFRAAHYAKTGLTLGYHTAARVFRSGQFGEDKILEYFFRDSPVDAALMEDPRRRAIMRDNLFFCFQDPSQIARDVGDWGADWSDALATVAKAAPVLFLHGAAHTFQPAARIADLADGHENIACQFFEGAAQMALYEHPAEIAAALASLGNR